MCWKVLEKQVSNLKFCWFWRDDVTKFGWSICGLTSFGWGKILRRLTMWSRNGAQLLVRVLHQNQRIIEIRFCCGSTVFTSMNAITFSSATISNYFGLPVIDDIYFNMFFSYPFFHHDFPIITGWLFRGLTPWGVAAAAGKAAAKAAEVEGAPWSS